MLMVSSDIVSLGAPGTALFLIVILTALRAVFICGVTEVMVPCTIVPFLSSMVTVSLAHFMRNLLLASQHWYNRRLQGSKANDVAQRTGLVLLWKPHVPDELHIDRATDLRSVVYTTLMRRLLGWSSCSG